MLLTGGWRAPLIRPTCYTLGSETVNLSYDPAGRLTGSQESGTAGVNRIFDYDALHRLVDVQTPEASRHYDYDAIGNRLSEAVGTSLYNYSYSPNSSRLAALSGPQGQQLYSFDANGSLTGDGVRQYGYNSRGRLNQLTTSLGTHQYRINGLGQRVMKIPPTGNRTIFHYDLGGQLLAETDGLGVVQKEYIWQGSTPVAVVLPPSDGQAERSYAIHADHLDTPRAIVSASNAVLWRWDASAFGQGLPNEDVDGNGKKLVINLRHPGQYYDQETGLFYNNFRDYDPVTGRYIQSDPIGLGGGINTYTYVLNNPVNLIDPTGENPRLVWQCLKNPLVCAKTVKKIWNSCKSAWENTQDNVESQQNTIQDNFAKKIFGSREGHLPDTPENRALLENVANDPATTLGPDKFGNQWSATTLEDGAQVWTQTRNGNIINGGLNETPQTYNPQTGLSAIERPNWK